VLRERSQGFHPASNCDGIDIRFSPRKHVTARNRPLETDA
jgi:hypothetical protein